MEDTLECRTRLKSTLTANRKYRSIYNVSTLTIACCEREIDLALSQLQSGVPNRPELIARSVSLATTEIARYNKPEAQRDAPVTISRRDATLWLSVPRGTARWIAYPLRRHCFFQIGSGFAAYKCYPGCIFQPSWAAEARFRDRRT